VVDFDLIHAKVKSTLGRPFSLFSAVTAGMSGQPKLRASRQDASATLDEADHGDKAEPDMSITR